MSDENDYGPCRYRADKKCIGADKCLRQSDNWIQKRVDVNLNFQNTRAASSSATGQKEAHEFFHALKLSESLGKTREAFLDNFINAKKKCAFEKLITAQGIADKLPDDTKDSETFWKSQLE